ncbi:MAG: DUF6572 domain-containing protein [Acidimicrobiales bacterium]
MGLRRRSDGGDGDSCSDVGPSGLEQPDVVDYVVDEADGTISMVISETRPWDGGREQVDQLMAKVNAYVTFVGNGALVEQLPAAEGRPVRVLLHAFHVPAGEVTEALPILKDGLDSLGLGFDIQVLGGAGW